MHPHEEPPAARAPRPVHRVLGDAVRLALIRDPVLLLLVPLLLSFPAIAVDIVLEQRKAPDAVLPEVDLRLAPVLVPGWVLGFVGQMLGHVLVIRRVGASVTGRSRRLAEEFEGALGRFFAVAVVTLLVTLMILPAMLLFVAPAFVVLYFFGFSPQVAALGDAGPAAALRQSRETVRGLFGRWAAGVGWLLGSAVVIALATGLIWHLSLERLGAPSPVWLAASEGALIALYGFLLQAAWTAFYLDLSSLKRARTVPAEPEPGTSATNPDEALIDGSSP